MTLRKYLGEIMTDKGYLTGKQLNEALERQREIFAQKTLPERLQGTRRIPESQLSTDESLLLGHILVDMQFATMGQLEEALKEQQKIAALYRSLDSERIGAAIEIGSIVNSSLNLSEVLTHIMRHANRVTHSAASTLMLLDDQTGELVFSVPTGPKADKLTDMRIPKGKGIAGWAAEHGEPVLVPDVKADPRFYEEIDRISGFETKSILCVPLKAKTKLIGVLEVVNKVDGTAFTEQDALLLSIFASQAAMAIENARLHGELKDRLEETVEMQKRLAEDIRERRRAERALRESEERYKKLYDESKRAEEVYRSLLHTSADAIVIYDLQGNVRYINPSFTKIFGWSLEEMEGKQIDFIPESEKEATRANLRQIMEHGIGIQGFETKRYTKDGRLIDVNISASRYNDHKGNPAGTLVVLRDTSEKKRLEAQFQAAQRMESLGTLAGGIAHDFNNILMGIQGNASLMLLDIDSGHSHFRRLKNIEDYVRSGADLTRQLLGFARGGKYEVKPLDLNGVIQGTSEMFSRAKKEITIRTTYQEGIWSVEADRGQIEQVLLNLYVNAWQAMSGGGELYLETKNVILDARFVQPYGLQPGKYVKITVRDTGVGMDEATRKRVFDPFFTTKEMGRGTGLGLASVYGIVTNHGGIIDVQSEKGKGSTFEIYLPASGAKGRGEGRLSEDIIEGSGTVLLIDDEEMVIESVKQMIERLGYQVLVARSGAEALEIYRKEAAQIHVVILDMIMPGMGGGETFDRLKEINPHIKVLLSSGYSVEERAMEIMDRGCDGFIQKPFDLRRLSQELSRVLGPTERHSS